MSVEELKENGTKESISIVTILHGEKEFIPLIKDNYRSFCDKNNHTNYLQELEIVLVDDGKENLSEHFSDLENCIYLHLNKDEINTFMDQIDEGYKQPNKSGLQYQRKCKTLPN